MYVQSTVKTIIRPYCSLTKIVRTEKQDEPLIMSCKNIIPFDNSVNKLQFGLHELPRIRVCRSLDVVINITTDCLESITHFGVYGLPLNGNIKNSYMFNGISDYGKNLKVRKRLSGESRAKYLKGEKIRRRHY